MGCLYPYMIYSLTDETYSVLCSCRNDAALDERGHRAAFYIALLHHLYWITGSVIGAVAGELVAFDTTGIDFAMTALFVVILVDQLRSGKRDVILAASVAVMFAVIFLLTLGPDAFLLPTLMCAVLALAAIDRFTTRKEDAHE